MRPYYEHAGVTIYHGDCREILPHLGAEALITDPIWPNCEHVFPGINAEELLHDALEVANVRRVAIQIGCASDPRFLNAVPLRWPYIRTCWLEYACPSYQGRVLNTGDVAYIFGEPPTSRPGAMVLPGVCIARTNDRGFTRWNWASAETRQKERGTAKLEHMPHPTPRRTEHVRWLVKWFGGESIIDPFAGSGTTLLEAKNQGIHAIGIEIEEKYWSKLRGMIEYLREYLRPDGRVLADDKCQVGDVSVHGSPDNGSLEIEFGRSLVCHRLLI